MKSINCVLLCLLVFASVAFAAPITYVVTDNPTSMQDPLLDNWTDELGVAFPVDELISACCEETMLISCSLQYDPQGASNYLVTITNLTGSNWYNLTYVADPETTITNDDLQLVNGQQAFTIDYEGLNSPLVYESMTADAVFEVDETWQFIIQNYTNTNGLPAAALTSWDYALGMGLVGDQSGGDLISSGSIIAIPEPGTMVMLCLGVIGIYRKK